MIKVTFYTIGLSNLILSAFLYGGVNDQFITSEEIRELRKTTIEFADCELKFPHSCFPPSVGGSITASPQKLGFGSSLPQPAAILTTGKNQRRIEAQPARGKASGTTAALTAAAPDRGHNVELARCTPQLSQSYNRRTAGNRGVFVRLPREAA